MQHEKFGLQNQLQRIVTSKFMLRMCRLNLVSISKFSDFCGISKLNLILYQILIVIESKIKKDSGKIFVFIPAGFQVHPRPRYLRT